MCISIWWTDYGTVHSEFMASVLKTLNDDSFDRKLICSIGNRSGSSLSLNRNSAMEAFLNTECETVLLIDADTLWTKDLVYSLYDNLINNNLDILSAVTYYFDQDGQIKPIAFNKTDYGIVHANLESDIQEIDLTGMGAILIKRKVIESTALQNNYSWNKGNYWFAEVSEDGFIGEDFFFFNNVKKTGYILYIDSKTNVPHIKKKSLVTKDFYINRMINGN